MSLSNDQKRTIVNNQEQFIQSYKILTLSQIKDLAQQNPMHIREDEMQDEDPPLVTNYNNTQLNLQQTNIQQFLLAHYKAGDGDPLFDYVYPPINETIELLVSREHFNEARHAQRF